MTESPRKRPSIIGANNPNWRNNAGRRICAHCRGEFRRYNSKAKFCSHACYCAAVRSGAFVVPKHTKPETLCVKCGGLSVKYRRLCLACRPYPKPQKCRGCERIVRKPLRWCVTCKLRGSNLKPVKTSTCHRCQADVAYRYRTARKYCDRCWEGGARVRSGVSWRRDLNHGEIVDALERAGCPVIDISNVGKGAPDLIVLRRDKTITLFEIKSPRGKLNPLQVAWHARWNGQVHVVRTVDEALKLAGVSIR